MSETKELRKIKKMYGEKFMHLCRELFPTLLDQEGLLTEILTSSFSTNSNTLYEDIMEEGVGGFKDFIYSKVDVEKDKPEIINKKTPYQLLEEVGYNLYECKTEEEIQEFKKYYKKGEELCTFVGGRLNKCEVFWAIKKNAEKLKREEFIKPKREDEYGTSVMGIQFSKQGRCTVSIKNRYNHRVNNPDATYGNDLDRIVPGLTQSFKELLAERGLIFDDSNIVKFELPGYTVAKDEKYYKYNYECRGKYYCPGNIIIDNGNVIKLEPEKKILIDYYILDKKNKTIELYEGNKDSFIDSFENIEAIEVKKIKEEKGTRVLTIKTKNSDKPIIIKLDENNCIIGYKNEKIEKIGNGFLEYNETMSQIELPNVQEIGDDFLYFNIALKQLKFPNLKKIGIGFVGLNEIINQVELPNVREVGHGFLYHNYGLRRLILPLLQKVGVSFLGQNEELDYLEVPNLKKMVGFADTLNDGLNEIRYMGYELYGKVKAEEINYKFLYNNKWFNQMELQSVEEILDFFGQNKGINTKDIAKLDEQTSLTTTEVEQANKIIKKITQINYEKDVEKNNGER